MTTKPTQFTPGPLETTYEPATKTWGVCLPDGGDVLAQLVEREADATLFAAAPAMYEALLELVICPAFNGQVFERDKESHRAWTLARNAIAQAEGR